jgi:hypothetical protein
MECSLTAADFFDWWRLEAMAFFLPLVLIIFGTSLSRRSSLGITLTIAFKHYLLTANGDFARAKAAKGSSEKAVQIPVQQPRKRVAR